MSYSQYLPTHPSRLNVYNKFYNKFYNKMQNEMRDNKMQNEMRDENSKDVCMKLAINIEKSVFNHSIDNTSNASKTWNDNFKNIYIRTSVKLYRTINNDIILTKIIKQSIDYVNLVSMSSTEINTLIET